MNAGKRIVATALGGALLFAATTGLSAADSWSSMTMKPRMAKSLDAGGAHVVSYFLNADGICQLTLMIAEGAGPDGVPASATRLQLTVEPGRTARFDGADGKSSRFTCLGRAEAMSVTKIDRVALSPGGE